MKLFKLIKEIIQLIRRNSSLDFREGHQEAISLLVNQGFLKSPDKDRCSFPYLKHDSYCGRPLLDGDNMCYWHSQNLNKYKQEIINQYFKEEITLKEAIEIEVRNCNSLHGAYLPEASIGGNYFNKGANLSGAELRGANLTGAHLSYGSLKNANLIYANLESSFLGDVDISGACLTGANLYNVKLRNNNFDGVEGLDKECFRGWKWGIIPVYHILEEYPQYNKPVYRAMKIHFSQLGAYDDASWAAYKEYEADRRLLVRNFKPLQLISEKLVKACVLNNKIKASNIIVRSLMDWLINLFRIIKSYLSCFCFGYGERPLRVLLVCGLTIITYALLYCGFDMLTESTFRNALYFSIVTFTTLGYGDLTATKDFQLFASSEAVIGLILIGLFLFTLARRGAGRG